MKNINLDDARILKNTNLDADESAFLTRQLTYVRKQALQVKKAPLNAFTVFPVMTDVPAGAETAVQRIYDSVGMAEVISNYGDDLKRVDLVAKENAVRVVTVGDAYGYNYKELRNAMFANMNLDAMRASAARRAIDAKLNRIAWHGDSAHNVIGFLNNDNITAFSLPADGTSNATELSKKTEENVIRDMNDFIESIPEQTKQVEQANTVLLAPKAYNHLATTRLKDSDRTILEFLQGVHPEIIRWMKIGELEKADNGKDVMIAGNFIPEYIKFEIPNRFTQMPVQPNNLEYKVPCLSEAIGVSITMPLAFAKASGC